MATARFEPELEAPRTPPGNRGFFFGRPNARPAPSQCGCSQLCLLTSTRFVARAYIVTIAHRRWFQGRRMPAKKSLPHIPGLPLRPTCPKCSQPMNLARTAKFKGHAGIEDRTYKCLKCGHSESWI